MSLSPTVVPKRVAAPSPFSGASFEGWNGPSWSNINPAFVDPPQADGTGGSGGTLIQSVANSDSQSNAQRIKENVPGTFLIGVEYWYTPSDLEFTDVVGNKLTIPAGAMLAREVQGESAYTPPAPPVVILKAVFGMERRAYAYSDGVTRRSWAAFNGTTYKTPQVFQSTPANSEFQPGVTGPLPGTFCQVINEYMGPSGVIVELGDTAELPADG